MKARKRNLVIASLVVLTVFIGFKVLNKPYYGNTEEMIIESIQNFDLFEDDVIEILEIYDFDDDRYVTFLADDTPSFISFNRNDKGNYERRIAEKKLNDIVGQFVNQSYSVNDQIIVFHVKSKSTDTNTVTFKANDIIYHVTFDDESPNSQYTILEPSEDGTYEMDWMKTDEDM